MAFAERQLNVVLNLAAALESEDVVDNFPIAIDKKAGWEELHSTISVAHRLFANQDGIVHPHVFGELRDFLFAGVVHSDSNHLEALWTVLLLHLFEPGHLNLTRLAPSGPEVDENCLAAEVREADGFSVERLEAEFGSRLAFPGGNFGLGSSARQVRRSKQHGGDGYHDHYPDQRITFHSESSLLQCKAIQE